MPEEQVQTEAQEAAPNAPEAGKANGEAPNRKGTDFVDFDGLPDEIRQALEPRFKRLYANMKDYERRAGEATEAHKALLNHNKLLADKLDELQQGQHEDKLGTLQERIKTAATEGDVDAVAELTAELAKQNAPVAVQPKQPATNGLLTPQGAQRVELWAAERDEEGHYKRPWALAHHPKQAEVVAMAQAYLLSGTPLEEALSLVEQKMNGQSTEKKKAPSGDPLPSGDASGSPKGKLKLSDDQIRAAQKMGVTPEAYAKQLEITGA